MMLKKIKDILKINPEPAKGKLVNPADPWQLKSNISESSLLDRYLNSRGINPRFVSKETKISHAKSGEFLKWKQDHLFDEEVDKEDTITFDIPLFIRVLEYAREDAKDDMDLHKMTEKLISIRDKGTLTMSDYEFITKLKEEMGLDESALDKWRKAASERQKKHNDIEKEMKARHASGKEDMKGAIDRLEKSLNKEETEHKVGDSVTVNSKFFGKQKGKVTKVDNQSVHVQRDGKKTSEKYPHDAVMKEGLEEGFKVGDPVRHKDGLSGTVTKDEDKDGIVNWKGPTAGYRVSHSSVLTKRTEVPRWRKVKEETVSESQAHDEGHRDRWYHRKPNSGYEIGSQEHKDYMDAYTGKHKQQLKNVKTFGKTTSENTLDPKAATEAPVDGANTSESCGCNMKKEMSKSARIIKALYKKKGVVKEDLYDHEKEDKSVKSYGKKPKMEKIENEKEPQAFAVMTGGKTMTGQNRDTLEIDPSMKTRPNSPDVFDTTGKKK